MGSHGIRIPAAGRGNAPLSKPRCPRQTAAELSSCAAQYATVPPTSIQICHLSNCNRTIMYPAARDDNSTAICRVIPWFAAWGDLAWRCASHEIPCCRLYDYNRSAYVSAKWGAIAMLCKWGMLPKGKFLMHGLGSLPWRRGTALRCIPGAFLRLLVGKSVNLSHLFNMSPPRIQLLLTRTKSWISNQCEVILTFIH